MAIKFENVSKTYDNEVKALQGITATIEQGEFVTIIGLSSAGKSTMLKRINKIHDITDGTLIVNVIDTKTLKGQNLRTFKRKICMVFQSFNLISKTTVLRNVLSSRVAEMPLYKTLLGIYSKEDKILGFEAETCDIA